MFNYKSLLVSLTWYFFISPGIATEKAVGYCGWFELENLYIRNKFIWAGEFSGSFQSADKGLFHKQALDAQHHKG